MRAEHLGGSSVRSDRVQGLYTLDTPPYIGLQARGLPYSRRVFNALPLPSFPWNRSRV